MLDLHTSDARLHGSQSAAAGARRGDVRHGAIAEVCRRSIPRLYRRSSSIEARAERILRDDLERSALSTMRRSTSLENAKARNGSTVTLKAFSNDRVNRGPPLAHPHRRSAAHQSGARVHRRRRQTAAALHRLHAVLPRRGGRRRQGHARHDPPAPVHQGRAGLHHHAGKIARTSTSACSPAPRKC